MNDPYNEPIKPAEIPLLHPEGQADNTPARTLRQPLWIGISLAALLVLAVSVIFALPRWVTPNGSPPSETIPTTVVLPEDTSASLQQDTQQLAAREEIQKLLPRLLEVQQELERKGVNHWAEEDYQRAQALSATGDSRYRQRDFVTALQDYRQSWQQLEDLRQSIEPRLQQAIAAGLSALLAGEGDEAQQHFELALAIDTNNEAALEGLARKERLDEVLAAMARGQQQEQDGHLQSARAAYAQAQALDAAFTPADVALARVDAAIAEQRYQAALNQGFAALQAGNDSAAQRAFRDALAIRAGDSAASAGLTQATNRITQRRITAALAQASEYEKQERWQDAQEAYAHLQQEDNTLVAARSGYLRTRARLNLDQQIVRILADPLKLRDDATLDQASRLLQDAKALTQPGPRLRQQIVDLEQTVQQATVPVTVTLHSDNRTQVVLLRVADLGTLEQTALALRPGRYVATGSRNGYRDVRVEFEVLPGSDVIAVEVICREPVRS